MRALIRLPLSFVALQLAYSGIAWACSCGMDPFLEDPAGAAADIDLIFVAEVTEFGEARSSGCGGAVSSADPRPVTFEVTRAIKGVEEGEVFELTTARDGASCGITAEEGELWLVGLDAGADSIGLCTPGGPVLEGYDEAVDLVIAEVEGEGG